MLTSTRSYSLPTYMIVGLNAAYLRIVGEHSTLPIGRFDSRLAKRLAAVSTVVLSVFYVYVRLKVRHGHGFGH